MSQPAARESDLHECPLCDGNQPHIGGIITTGNVKVMIDNIPSVTVGAICQCQSPSINKVSSGSKKVQVTGLAVTRQGDSTSHGGTISTGSDKVRIS